MNNYVKKNGAEVGTFLAVSYYVNGWQGMSNDYLAYVRETNDFRFDRDADKIIIGNESRGLMERSFNAPYGWEKRLDYYNKVKGVFGQ